MNRLDKKAPGRRMRGDAWETFDTKVEVGGSSICLITGGMNPVVNNWSGRLLWMKPT